MGQEIKNGATAIGTGVMANADELVVFLPAIGETVIYEPADALTLVMRLRQFADQLAFQAHKAKDNKKRI